MAEDLPFAPWENALPTAPWETPERGVLERAGSAMTDVQKSGQEALNTATNLGEKKDPRDYLGPSGAWRSFKETGAGIAALATPIMAPLAGVESLAASGLGAAQRGIEKGLANIIGTVAPEAEKKLEANIPTSEQAYETARPYVGAALSAARPGLVRAAPPMPAAPNQGPLGVTLSEGQLTGALPAIKREQAALRSQAGDPAYQQAQAFREQQLQQVETAKTKIATDLDQLGNQVLAQTPQEAGELVSSGMQSARNIAKSQVDVAYKEARELGGEIHAGAFEGMPQQIKGDLTLSADPVVIDNRMTPAASSMIDYLDAQIGRLKIQNKADPFAQPDPQNIVGVDLNGIDRWRRNLSAIRRGAATREDMRASGRVLDDFDNRIEAAVNNGMFTGDPDAISAWNAARRAHADYRSTFTERTKDPVGKVVEKILGRGLEDPATPNDVMSFITGAPGVSPKSLNVQVAKRLKTTLGDTSPEWTAVKQGVFQKLVKMPSNRLNEFLTGNGKELANQLYAPHERQLLQSYGELMEKLKVPQAGAQWSNHPWVEATRKVITYVGTALGAAIGHAIGGGEIVGGAIGYGAAQMGERVSQIANTRRIAKQMPLIATQTQNWQRAVAAAGRASPVGAAALAQASKDLANSLGNLIPAGTARAQEKPKMARGGSLKQPKAAVDYGHGMPAAHCGICTYFHKNGVCDKVQGIVKAEDWCKLFRRRIR